VLARGSERVYKRRQTLVLDDDHWSVLQRARHSLSPGESSSLSSGGLRCRASSQRERECGPRSTLARPQERQSAESAFRLSADRRESGAELDDLKRDCSGARASRRCPRPALAFDVRGQDPRAPEVTGNAEPPKGAKSLIKARTMISQTQTTHTSAQTKNAMDHTSGGSPGLRPRIRLCRSTLPRPCAEQLLCNRCAVHLAWSEWTGAAEPRDGCNRRVGLRARRPIPRDLPPIVAS
jgi:hypothetical protein